MPYLCFHHKLYHKMFAVDHCGVPTLLRWSHFLLQPVNMVYFINSLSFLRTIFISLRCAGPLLQRADLPAQRLLFVRGGVPGAGFSLFSGAGALGRASVSLSKGWASVSLSGARALGRASAGLAAPELRSRGARTW